MPSTNNIDILYNKANAAVDRLSVADNHWTFKKIAGNHAWNCFNHGHKEALLIVEYDRHSTLNFKVIDTGLIRFNNGQTEFRFSMPTELDDNQEDSYLDTHLIAPLNTLHGVTGNVVTEEDQDEDSEDQ